ncbi:MAG TPA: mechanosensitive ion channel family protein [Bryobacteraceae bacterium]|nr:mechanosensitive ion channel family protein [Bryobacteraceae bacterium]
MQAYRLPSVNGYLPYVLSGARVLFIIGLGYVLSIVLRRLIGALRSYSVRVMVRKGQALDFEVEKRATTVANVISRPLMTLLWAAVILMSLEELGFKIEALLAGAGISAGIIGVAVGFGAQNLIKDVIGGLFLLVENQIRVNDVAVINGTGGLVEEINLRTTVLRSENGAVHIFPNGSIQTLSNLTREFSYYVFEIAVAFDQDTDRVIAILTEIAAQLRLDPAFGPAILADLDVMGVDRLGPNGVTIKARIKTLPQKQWMIGREMNRRIRMKFQSENIEIPSATAIVRLVEPALLFSPNRDELKAAIREVLSEMRVGPPSA